MLAAWAPKVADAIHKIPGVVDVLNGIDNTISGPAVMFQVDPSVAARAGFTAEEVATDAAAILEGEPATAPVVANDRAYTLRVRFPAGNRASLDAMRDTLLTSSTGRTATLGALAHGHRTAGANRNSPREPAARRRGDGSPGRNRPGQRHGCREESRDGLAPAGEHSRGVWRNVSGAAEVVSRSGSGAGARHPAGFYRAAV